MSVNVFNDRIKLYNRDTQYQCFLYHCLNMGCRFKTCTNRAFVKHKAGVSCSYYNDWFFKMKKKGFNDYWHIIHKYFWDRVMDDIRK